jgi:hypothetical protein
VENESGGVEVSSMRSPFECMLTEFAPVLHCSLADSCGIRKERCYASHENGKVKATPSNGLLHGSVSGTPLPIAKAYSSRSLQRLQSPSSSSVALCETVSVPMQSSSLRYRLSSYPVSPACVVLDLFNAQYGFIYAQALVKEKVYR